MRLQIGALDDEISMTVQNQAGSGENARKDIVDAKVCIAVFCFYLASNVYLIVHPDVP